MVIFFFRVIFTFLSKTRVVKRSSRNNRKGLLRQVDKSTFANCSRQARESVQSHQPLWAENNS